MEPLGFLLVPFWAFGHGSLESSEVCPKLALNPKHPVGVGAFEFESLGLRGLAHQV